MAKSTGAEGSNKKKKSKNKMKNKLGFLRSGVKKTKEQKENPFESIWARRKFDILGKKRKNDERRRVGLSRSIAIDKRQKTLLKEYEQSTKSSTFLDKRIGQQNEGLSEFEKAILRSQRERQSKLKRKSKYNLSDGEEDDFDIPEGDYFPDRDDFDDEVPLDEEEDDRSFGIEKKFSLEKLNPNEGEDGMDSISIGQENKHKTKKEVMEDIISKSKFFKAQKAKDKEENGHIIEQLDKDFTSLAQSGSLVALTQPNKMKALKSLVNNSNSNGNAETQEIPSATKKVSVEKGKPDDYDKLVSEMALDIRARPSDRTKTAEELAQEEKDRLERLEEERQWRMGTTDDSGDEGAESAEEDDDESGKHIRHISGDDLGDSFSNDAVSRNKVVWIDDILGKGKADGHVMENSQNSEDSEDDDEGDDDDDDDDGGDNDDDDDAEKEEDNVDGFDEDAAEDKKKYSIKDWEQSDDEYVENDLDEEEEEADNSDDKQVDVVAEKKLAQSTYKLKESPGHNKVKLNLKEELDRKGELPYTIEAPKNFEELSTLFENRSDDQIVEAIRRIRTFNAITIAAENRKKMQVFYGVLLQYFATLTNKKPLNFPLLNLLVKPLMEMSAEIPYFAAICARQRLLHTRTQFCEDLKNAGKSCWPNLKTLLLLRLWSMVFPCSDLRHAVITPAILLMSEYLMRCRIISGRDIAVGSFLCSMVLSVCRQSQRFCPEAITFIQTMLMAGLNHSQIIESSQLYHLMKLRTVSPLLRLEGHVGGIHSLDFLALMELPDDSSYFTSDEFRASMLSTILGNLKGFVDIYQGLKSFPEIFLPILKILHGLEKEDQTPETLKVEIKDIVLDIENKCGECHLVRQPLRYQKVKVLKTIAPKFEDNFVKGRDYDPDKERAEMKKLKKRLKQEAKGAARELRKDNYFLLDVKKRDQARTEEEKAEKYGKYRAFLQEQEHAFKSGQLGKGKGRSRRK